MVKKRHSRQPTLEEINPVFLLQAVGFLVVEQSEQLVQDSLQNRRKK
jgi:hypothetical protein